MLTTFALLSFLTSAAIAADSNNSNPLVPSGISQSCTTFLKGLDSSSNMGACTSSLIAATKAYGPGGNATASQGGISSTLTTLCSSSTQGNCPDSLIRSTLADFQTACSDELTANPNKDVVRTYDVLYALTPLRNAVCQKDDDGSWCITQKNAASSAGNVNLADQSGVNPSNVEKYLYVQVPTVKRDVTAAMYPNTTTFCQSNLAFTFLQPTLSHDNLCTVCTRNIITAYTTFETAVPYAPGLGQSQLLCGQSALLKSVKTTCGRDFLSSSGPIAAGSLSGSPIGTNTGSRNSASLGGGLVSFAGTLLVIFLSLH